MPRRSNTLKDDSDRLQAFDQTGRPIVHDLRKVGFNSLADRCCQALYALALTELRGNKLGFSKSSIRKTLEYASHPLAGTWDFTFNRDFPVTGAAMTPKVATNAIQDLRDRYPIIVLIPGQYVPVPDYKDRSSGGVQSDVYKLNSGAILGWPCGAHIISLLATGIQIPNPIRYRDLALKMPAEHNSHFVPEALRGIAPEPTAHTLREDIEFLVRTRYLKLFTDEQGSPKRKEIVHAKPLLFDDDAVIQLEDRATWELPYARRLARHFQY